MMVTHRLYLTALPSAVGLVTVAALAYWGQFARTVPELFLVVALVATVVTFGLTWANVRYVAVRVERLASNRGDDISPESQRSAHATGSEHTRDELDVIEGTVTDLSGAVRSAEVVRARELARSELRNREQAQVLSTVANSALQRLDEVRLPLHILLENHFGDLNENQEEMLGAARAATESVDDELAAVAELAGLELGSIVLRRDRVFPADILDAILPTLRAQAAGRNQELQSDIARLVPPLHADAARLQRAMLVLLSECIKTSNPEAHLTLKLSGDRHVVVITLMPATPLVANARTLLARRVIEATGGDTQLEQGVFAINLRN
ncbi:MAG: hypothetical protein ABJB74_11290 [Gemmatimonas sp.]